MTSKTVFTTGEAAKICKVSQQTIIRCFDSGQLKGFRVPGSRFRRIPREQLVHLHAGQRHSDRRPGKRQTQDPDRRRRRGTGRTDRRRAGARRPVRGPQRQQRLRRRHDGQGISAPT